MDNIEFYREKINLALKEFFDKKLKEDGKYSPKIRELIENVIEYNMRGGKRIRPAIVIFAYKCFNDKNNEEIIKAAISLELMQAYLLIHDDIIDKSDLRRGKLSMHKIYGKKNEDFGINMAILAGDLCSSYTYDSIIECGFPAKEKNKAIEYLGWIINREIYGQTLDIIPGFSNLSEEDVWKIYELKTATYTTQGPVYLGCVLANAPLDKIKKLQEYATNLGIAFQIQDDLNGIFASVDFIGKPIDSDIREGKKTLIIVKTLELCSKDERKFILKEYGNSSVSEESIIKIRKIIKKCGAYDYCVDKFKELVTKSKNSIIV